MHTRVECRIIIFYVYFYSSQISWKLALALLRKLTKTVLLKVNILMRPNLFHSCCYPVDLK